MRIGKTWKVSVPGREAFQRTEHGNEPAEQKAEPVPHHDEIGVIGYKGAGGSKVQKRPCCWSLIAEGVDVCHHVVPEPTLVPRGNLEIGVVQVRPHLGDGLLWNVEPELALGFG
jgi:hypothetical protein